MKLLILKSTNPYLNLATEEYLFKNTSDNIFMLWQNEPTIVIGKNQNVYTEINMEYVKKHNIHIVRRITGGGAVYHDLGNINYSFISTKTDNQGIDFKYFTTPIIEALSHIGVNATLSGRNDLEVNEKKISGNAQHREGDRVLHHGTILFDANLEILSQALNVDEIKMQTKAIKSTRSRVINIKNLLTQSISASEFINIIAEYISKKYNTEAITAPNCDEVYKLKSKYESDDWIYPKKDFISNYSVIKKKKYDFGIVELNLEMSNDIIRNIKIHGDFFGTKDISVLEEKIRNNRLSEVEKALHNINIGEYIFGMNSELILKQIIS